MAERVDCAWNKLNKYYTLSDQTIAYVAAIMLNLMHKWQWFEQRWITPALTAALI